MLHVHVMFYVFAQLCLYPTGRADVRSGPATPPDRFERAGPDPTHELLLCFSHDYLMFSWTFKLVYKATNLVLVTPSSEQSSVPFLLE